MFTCHDPTKRRRRGQQKGIAPYSQLTAPLERVSASARCVQCARETYDAANMLEGVPRIPKRADWILAERESIVIRRPSTTRRRTVPAVAGHRCADADRPVVRVRTPAERRGVGGWRGVTGLLINV